MNGTITDVIDNDSVETTLKVEIESGETFTTSFDKKCFMARYSGFKHRYGCYPEDSEGVSVSVSPPCDFHGGKIDILSN